MCSLKLIQSPQGAKLFIFTIKYIIPPNIATISTAIITKGEITTVSFNADSTIIYPITKKRILITTLIYLMRHLASGYIYFAFSTVTVIPAKLKWWGILHNKDKTRDKIVGKMTIINKTHLLP